ncbi:MAG: hypothetical protein AB7U64_14225, partial [Blastocatellales bacterium]
RQYQPDQNRPLDVHQPDSLNTLLDEFPEFSTAQAAKGAKKIQPLRPRREQRDLTAKAAKEAKIYFEISTRVHAHWMGSGH